jgi:uncharacterized protein HemX
VAVALLAALGALGWCYGLSNHVQVAEQKLAAEQASNKQLEEKLEATNARLRATSETLGQTVGMTQRQIEAKTQAILASQAKTNAQTVAETKKLAAAEADTSKQVSAVSSDGRGRREDRCGGDAQRS